MKQILTVLLDLMTVVLLEIRSDLPSIELSSTFWSEFGTEWIVWMVPVKMTEWLIDTIKVAELAWNFYCLSMCDHCRHIITLL